MRLGLDHWTGLGWNPKVYTTMHKGRRACDARYVATGLLGLDRQLTQTVAKRKRASTAAS